MASMPLIRIHSSYMKSFGSFKYSIYCVRLDTFKVVATTRYQSNNKPFEYRLSSLMVIENYGDIIYLLSLVFRKDYYNDIKTKKLASSNMMLGNQSVVETY